MPIGPYLDPFKGGPRHTFYPIDKGKLIEELKHFITF